MKKLKSFKFSTDKNYTDKNPLKDDEITPSKIIGYKSEICHTCGQKVDPIIYKKYLIKKLKKRGLPSLAKLLFK